MEVMAMSDPTVAGNRNRTRRSLWLGVLGSPSVWALHLQLLYLLVKVEKRTHSATYLYATTAACTAAVIYFGSLSVRDWLAIRSSPDDTQSASIVGRTRFLSLLGIAGSFFFALTILATGMAVYFLKPDWS
jgi:hypothetical protein